MNQLLEHYCTDVEFPHVSGAEHLEMLYIRDKLADIEHQLSEDEREALQEADRRLCEQADDFYAELSRFVDLAERRRQQRIAAARWWWYLDVLAQLPAASKSSLEASQKAKAPTVAS